MRTWFAAFALLATCSSLEGDFFDEEVSREYGRGHLKFVSIGSDDWGRWSNHGPLWPDLETRRYFTDTGLWLSGGEPHYHTVETGSDLLELFDEIEALNQGVHAPQQVVLTPFFVTSGPDYEGMRAVGCPGGDACVYKELHWHNSSAGLGREPYSRGDLRALYREGFEKGLWHPEYHGRSHFDVRAWGDYVRMGDSVTAAYFGRGLTYYDYGLRDAVRGTFRSTHSEYVSDDAGYQRSFEELEAWVGGGLEVFERMWGYPASVTACPCHHCQDPLGFIFADKGLVAVQGEQGGRGLLDGLESVGRVMYDPGFEAGDKQEKEEHRAWSRVELELAGRDDVAVQVHAQNFMRSTREEGQRDVLVGLLTRLVTRLRSWGGGGRVVFVTASEQVQLRAGGVSREIWHKALRYRNYSPEDVEIFLPDARLLYWGDRSRGSDGEYGGTSEDDGVVDELLVSCVAGGDPVFERRMKVGATLTIKRGCEYVVMWGSRVSKEERGGHADGNAEQESSCDK